MMRPGLFLSIAMVVSASNSMARAWDGPEDGAVGQRLAVIVGVATYDDPNNFGNLKYSDKDATDLAEVLKKHGYEVRLLLGTKDVEPGDRADRGSIEKAINEAIAKVKGPDDSLILAFSGHGLQVYFDDQDFKGFRSFFCPTDSRLRDQSARVDPESMIDLAKLFDQLKDCKAGMKLVLVDACQTRADGAKPGFTGPSTTRQDYLVKPMNTMALYGCEPGGTSYEVDDLKHGLFMYCVLKAFQGEMIEALDRESGDITFLSLQYYILNEVPRLCKQFGKGNQLPTVNTVDSTPTKAILRLDRYRDSLKAAEELWKQRKIDEAWNMADEATRKGPLAYTTWLLLAELDEEREISPRKVLEHSAKAIELLERNPTTPPIARAQARLIHARALYRSARGIESWNLEALKTARLDVDACLDALSPEGLQGDQEAAKLRCQAHFAKAQVALEMKDLGEARKSYDQFYWSLRRIPVDRRDRKWRKPEAQFDFQLLCTRLLLAEGRPEKALEPSGSLLKEAEKLNDPKRGVGTAYFEQGRVYQGLDQRDKAAVCFDRAFRSNPPCIEAGRRLAEIRIEDGEFARAFDLFRQLWEKTSSAEALVGMAQARIGLGKIADANEYLDQVLKMGDIAPRTRAKALVTRARASLAGPESDPKRAVEDCDQALKLDPAQPDASRVLAEARTKAGNASGAQDDRRRVLVPTSGTKVATGK